MRSVLSFLDAPQWNAREACVSFKPGTFGDDGEVRDEGTAKFLRHYMEECAAFVERALAANARAESASSSWPRKRCPGKPVAPNAAR